MFNGKKIDNIIEKQEKITRILFGQKKYLFGMELSGNCVGLEEKVSTLEHENAKLKAIVAELCDYVYKDEENK